MTIRQAKQLLSATSRPVKLSLFLALSFILCSPLTTSRIPTVLERVLQSGELTMLSRNGPTTYYEGTEGYLGFEYQLGAAFC